MLPGKFHYKERSHSTYFRDVKSRALRERRSVVPESYRYFHGPDCALRSASYFAFAKFSKFKWYLNSESPPGSGRPHLGQDSVPSQGQWGVAYRSLPRNTHFSLCNQPPWHHPTGMDPFLSWFLRCYFNYISFADFSCKGLVSNRVVFINSR